MVNSQVDGLSIQYSHNHKLNGYVEKWKWFSFLASFQILYFKTRFYSTPSKMHHILPPSTMPYFTWFFLKWHGPKRKITWTEDDVFNILSESGYRNQTSMFDICSSMLYIKCTWAFSLHSQLHSFVIIYII